MASEDLFTVRYFHRTARAFGWQDNIRLHNSNDFWDRA